MRQRVIEDPFKFLVSILFLADRNVAYLYQVAYQVVIHQPVIREIIDL